MTLKKTKKRKKTKKVPKEKRWREMNYEERRK